MIIIIRHHHSSSWVLLALPMLLQPLPKRRTREAPRDPAGASPPGRQWRNKAVINLSGIAQSSKVASGTETTKVDCVVFLGATKCRSLQSYGKSRCCRHPPRHRCPDGLPATGWALLRRMPRLPRHLRPNGIQAAFLARRPFQNSQLRNRVLQALKLGRPWTITVPIIISIILIIAIAVIIIIIISHRHYCHCNTDT